MRRIMIVSLAMILSGSVYAAENTVYIKNGKIVVETNSVTKALDYNDDEKYVQYNLEKWDVKENADPVQEALNIYKKKGEDTYTKRVFIVEKAEGGKNIFVEYRSKKDDRLIFSPNEDFAYYVGLSPSGVNMVYGLNLLTNKTFILDQGENLDLTKCQDEQSYVVIDKAGDKGILYVYNLDGKKVNSINYTGDLGDINQLVCK